MMSTNALSIFILRLDQKRVFNRILSSIQELMRMSKLVNKKFKHAWKYFPNTNILTKIPIPGGVQLTSAHASVGKKSLGESVTEFSLAGSLNSSTLVLIDVDIA